MTYLAVRGVSVMVLARVVRRRGPVRGYALAGCTRRQALHSQHSIRQERERESGRVFGHMGRCDLISEREGPAE